MIYVKGLVRVGFTWSTQTLWSWVVVEAGDWEYRRLSEFEMRHCHVSNTLGKASNVKILVSKLNQ